MAALTALDVLGVQRFVFLSNRLRDVVTGSYLVHWSTSKEGALKTLVPQSQILLAGGGNAIIEHPSLEKARSFAARYSRLIYDEAPGLDVALVHGEYSTGNLAQALLDLQINLARAKTERIPAASLLGLSVTASCRETGFPACGFDMAEPTTPLATIILKRREKREEANAHWEVYLKDWGDFAFPMELDHLGRTIGDTSMIGVVHVDGNGVGKKIKDWLHEKVNGGVDDDTVRREYQEWSSAIDELGKKAFKNVVDRLCQHVQEAVEHGQKIMRITGTPARLAFELKRTPNKKWFLPVRPILLGGDDLTFVCDSRIALDLAETALTEFEKSQIPHLGKISACAGVSVVRVHAPFARAYDLAEKLCGSAKRMLRENVGQTDQDQDCALDWHIGSSRPGETVESIRQRQYTTGRYSLSCRPYRLGSPKGSSESWRWLTRTLLDDRKVGLRAGVWAARRNKVKALADFLREGPDAVRQTLEAWQVVDKNLRLPQLIAQDGFIAKYRTPLLDALELMDLHLVLDPYEVTRGAEEKRS